jgi:Outer membrane protein beta-barrel domain
MKKVFGALVVSAILASASPVLAQGFNLYGSYWNTTDVDDAFGGGIGVGIPFGESGLGLKLAATYYQELTDDPADALFDDDEGVFEDESLEVLPVDVGLTYNFAPHGMWSPWISGGGSYFFIDTTREGIDVDDEAGFFVSLGTQIGNRDGVNFFAEALYRSTEATLRRNRLDGDDDTDVADEVAIDLDGVAVNAGISWRW